MLLNMSCKNHFQSRYEYTLVFAISRRSILRRFRSVFRSLGCKEIRLNHLPSHRLQPYVAKQGLNTSKDATEKFHKRPDNVSQDRYTGNAAEKDQPKEDEWTVTIQDFKHFFKIGRQNTG